MNMKSAVIGGPPASLVVAIERLLRPLVRVLLARGLTYPALAEILKSAYVQVAQRDFALPEKRQTGSRISLLTGIHRKDVKRLGRADADLETTPSNVSIGAQLVARWLTEARYLDPSDQPLPLPRLASDGGAFSFEALATSVSKDIRPRAVLDEWLRLGVAHIDDEDRVCLNVMGFIPQKGFDEKAYYFGQNLHDHIAAGVHNLLGQEPPFFERSAYCLYLTPASVDELARLAHEVGTQSLQKVYRRALELERRDDDQPEATMRINFGLFFFSDRENGS